MKHILYFLALITILISCGPEAEREETSYIIENNAEVEVILKLISSSNITTVNSLNQSERYRGQTREVSNPDRSDDSFAPSQSLDARMLTITFDNQRQLQYDVDLSGEDPIFSLPVNRNPLRHGNYEPIGNDEFLFTITQEDFENATPCDGPCE